MAYDPKNNKGYINEAAYNKALEKAQAKANETGKTQQLLNGDYVNPKKEVEKKEAAPASTSAIAAPTIAAPTYEKTAYTTVNPNVAASAEAQAVSKGAAEQMAASDAYTQAMLGTSGADALQKAQAAAAQTAQLQSDAAVQQALKAAKTGGAMGGQAALAATGQAANAYNQAQQAAQQQYFNLANLSQSQGQNMANRLAQTASDAQTRYQTAVNEALQKYQTETGAQQSKYSTDVGAQQQQYSTQVGAETQRYSTDVGAQTAKYTADVSAKTAKRGQNIGLLGGAVGAIGGVSGLFSSDRNLKTDIKKDSLSKGLEALKGFSYRYTKDGPAYAGGRKEAGVMAQDLEKTKLAPAVVDTPQGKMIDTRRLATMNTAINAEHEGRLKKIEALLDAMRNAKKTEATK